jgi:hypothetical protein
LISLVALAAVALAPSDANARPDQKGRPFGKGTFQPSLGLGASFGDPDINVVNLGLGARYFPVNGLGPGLSVDDTILIYTKSLKADFPGIEDQTPTNIVRLMPSLQWIFVRTRWFSPYVLGGVGPVFYNNGRGTVGQWLAGAGAYIGIGGPVFISLGVNFTGPFPRSDCLDAFTYNVPPPNQQSIQLSSCSYNISPTIGLALAFGVGGGGGKRKAKKNPPPSDEPPPSRGWDDPEPAEPEPGPEPVQPEPTRPEPIDPAPSDAEGPTPEGPNAPTDDPAVSSPDDAPEPTDTEPTVDEPSQPSGPEGPPKISEPAAPPPEDASY